MKRQLMDWKKIFANHVFDKKSIQLNSKKPNNPI